MESLFNINIKLGWPNLDVDKGQGSFTMSEQRDRLSIT